MIVILLLLGWAFYLYRKHKKGEKVNEVIGFLGQVMALTLSIAVVKYIIHEIIF